MLCQGEKLQLLLDYMSRIMEEHYNTNKQCSILYFGALPTGFQARNVDLICATLAF